MDRTPRDEYRELVEKSARLDALIRYIKRTDYLSKSVLMAIADMEDGDDE